MTNDKPITPVRMEGRVGPRLPATTVKSAWELREMGDPHHSRPEEWADIAVEQALSLSLTVTLGALPNRAHVTVTTTPDALHVEMQTPHGAQTLDYKLPLWVHDDPMAVQRRLTHGGEDSDSDAGGAR